jgi:hypothetical protein
MLTVMLYNPTTKNSLSFGEDFNSKANSVQTATIPGGVSLRKKSRTERSRYKSNSSALYLSALVTILNSNHHAYSRIPDPDAGHAHEQS